MKRQLRFPERNWSRWAVLTTMLLLIAGGAKAGPILSGAVSYESFGFNFVEYSQTSSTVGTLNYDGAPGCGGTCIGTTQLGPDPSVSLNVNAVVFDNTCCGGATAELGYYVEYHNMPGTYTVTMAAPESLSITDGLSNAFAYLAFGPADGSSGTLNPFNSYTLQEVDCVNGCQYVPVGGVTPAPFAAKTFQMAANTPYFVLLDLQINPSPSGLQQMAFIDPQFSTTAAGGYFAYSAGVTDSSAVPEPGPLVLVLSGLALLGGMTRQSRRE